MSNLPFISALNKYAIDHDVETKARVLIRETKNMLAMRCPFFSILLSGMEFQMTFTIPNFATNAKRVMYNPFFILGIPADLENDYRDHITALYTRQAKKMEPSFDINNGSEMARSVIKAVDVAVSAGRKKPTSMELVFILCHLMLHCLFGHGARKNNRDPLRWNMATDFVVNGILVKDRIGSKPSDAPYNEAFDGLTVEEVYERIEVSEEGATFSPFDTHEGDVPDDDLAEFRERALRCSKSAGSVPASLRQFIDNISKPKIDWGPYLIKRFKSLLKRDMSFARPSRRTRSSTSRAKLPGYMPEQKIDICIAIDMSGSTGGIRDNFFGEIYGMLSQHPSYRAKLLCFDTEVYSVVDFEDVDPEKLLSEYNAVGDGGTDFMCVWKYLMEQEKKPHQLVLLTDGYPCGEWGVPDYTDTIFVVVGSKEKAPFGTTLWYDDH
jgi:predicted metal-dependent peptidase